MVEAAKVLVLRLQCLEGEGPLHAQPGDRVMEFHLSRKAREELSLDDSVYRSTGNVVLPDFAAARNLARRINEVVDAALLPEKAVRAGRINAMALIDEILHDVVRLYREQAQPGVLGIVEKSLVQALGAKELERLLQEFVADFPPQDVYQGKTTGAAWLAGSASGAPNRHLALEEFLLLALANENPAFGPYRFLFDDGSRRSDDGSSRIPQAPLKGSLADKTAYTQALEALERCFAGLPGFGPDQEDLVSMLRAPVKASPYSLPGQLDYIRRHWGLVIGEGLLRLLGAFDLIKEEEKAHFPGPGPTRAYVYRGMEAESERFSPDKDWMPNVVLMAKTSLVWLSQLSRQYGREIRTLDQIPDEELDSLALRGFNGLWLIGLWERSWASAEIKRRNGNPEAAASAYSLYDYEIAGELGGWPALENLKARAAYRGIRLAADMVPNHVGIDSAWVRERPDLFMSSPTCPFPAYTFNGPNLSQDPRIGIWLEDHYWDRTDAAVVFKRLERATGRVDYIYHGNDGTGLPWSDTAQIDFLKEAAREAVKERILHVARNFPIIRFDAAMVLARKHFRRLWYPEPGSGGDIASRAGHALGPEDFDKAMPKEFWREVVDLCAKEAPDTLLLAEAFWMMEGYFVRSLGMHRVYNSAFMNMLKREENAKYRETIKNTQEFDKDILKRFVNFMNNPDEDTAVAQFGKGDKYFGVCTMMATMPGLPMFGHGQLEGFEEKYGMEYRRAYKDELPDPELLARHEREIYPLLKRRRLFSGVEDFLLYDLQGDSGACENVFAYSNGHGGERALVVYNNAYAQAGGRIRESAPYAEKLPDGTRRVVRKSLAEALGLGPLDSPGEGFLVMREERSGLWYIRSSREIAEQGLGVLLGGYQCQVFLDIFEVRDDPEFSALGGRVKGLYRAVCDALAGRGVPDLSEAVEDMALKDLYASLASFASRELFMGGREVLEAKATKAARRKLAAAQAGQLAVPAYEFYAGVVRLLEEEGSGEGPQSPATAPGQDLPVDKAGLARDRFLRGYLSLTEFAILAAAEGEEAGPARNLLDLLLAEGGVEVALAYLILEGFVALGNKRPGDAARRIAERFFLERKLREALRASGLPGDLAYRRVSLASFCLGRKEALDEALESYRALPGPGSLAAACVDSFAEALRTDGELRQRLGVNLFEGTQWFNKEAYEEVLSAAYLAGVLSETGPGAALRIPDLKKRLATSSGLAALLTEAEEASGFTLEGLVAKLAATSRASTPHRAARKPKAKPED